MTTSVEPPASGRGACTAGAARREGSTGFVTSASPLPASPPPTGSPMGSVPGFDGEARVVVGFGTVSPGCVVVDAGAVVLVDVVVVVVDDGVAGVVGGGVGSGACCGIRTAAG